MCENGGNRKKLCKYDCDYCFNRSFASHSLVIQWNYEKNGDLLPRQISKGARKKIWVICKNCPHSYYISPYNINSGRKCPYCSDVCKKLCDDYDCDYCYRNSFDSHPKSIYWNIIKNDEEPRSIIKGSHKKCWFTCPDCEHNFKKSILSVYQCHWCPYCTHQKLCKDDDCNFCFNNSFASHEKVKYWSERNKANPRHIFKCTKDKYYFNCFECKHDFMISLGGISNGWCPYCANKILCKDHEWCMRCYDKSFASHPMSELWNYDKNSLVPRQIFRHSGYKAWFTCHIHGDFCAEIFCVTDKRWCTMCRSSYGENEISNILKQKGIDFTGQKKFEDLGLLRYDFYFISVNTSTETTEYIIEYDGEQHFKDIEFFNRKTSYPERIRKDLEKTKYCIKNRIRLLRVSYKHIDNLYYWVDSFLGAEKKYIFTDEDLYADHIKLCQDITLSTLR